MQFLGVSEEFLVTGRDAEKMVNPSEEESILLYHKLNAEKKDALRYMAMRLSE